MSVASAGCCVRLVDDSPATNIDRSDVVCEPSESTGHATESGLVSTVFFGDMSTTWTRPGGIPRIHKNHRYASTAGLILDLVPQAGEAPRVMRRPLGAANRYPSPNALEVLKSDSSTSALRLGNDPLGDAMVNVFGEPPFLASQLLEEPLRRLGSFLLEFSPEASIAMADSVDVSMGRGVGLAVRIDGDVLDAEIDAKELPEVLRLGLFYLAGGEEVEVSITVDQVAFANLGLEKFPVPVAADEGNRLPAAYRPDGNVSSSPVLEPPSKDAGVVGKCAVMLKHALFVLVYLVGVSNFSEGPNNDLSRQIELRSDPMVEGFVESVLSKGLMFPRPLTNGVACGIGPLEGREKELILFGSRSELNFGCEPHGYIIAQCFKSTMFQEWKGGKRHSSPRLKSGVSCRSLYEARAS